MKRIGPLALALLVAAPLLLAACGDDDDSDTTVTSPGVSEEPATETGAAPAAPSGPTGALTPEGIGEVTLEDDLAEATKLFGAPEKTDRSPGCELAANPPDVLTLTYSGGKVNLLFNAETKAFDSYRVSDDSLESERGDTVGESFADLQGNWGDELEPLILGTEQPSETDGAWHIVDGPESQLLFQMQGGNVAFFQGGRISVCE